MTLCVSFVGKVDFTTRILLVEQLWQSVYYTLYLKRQMLCSLYLDYRHWKHNVINAASLNPLTMIYIYIYTSQVFPFPFMLTSESS